MRTARVTLLVAASLLAMAEIVSLSLLLRELSDQHLNRSRNAVEQAATLLPQIAAWVRAQDPATKPIPAIGSDFEPFDRLTLEDPSSPALSDDVRARLEKGELVPVSKVSDPYLGILGLIQSASGPRVFRLSGAASSVSRFATDRTLIAQHVLILLATLVGFALVGFAREAPASDTGPAVRAYEEAMSRLRVRDDERRATFERETSALNSILRDREAMARAGELTAGIVHEVRNSLGTVAAQAKFGESSSETRVRQGALAIAEEVRTLQSVMTRFLDFIRNEEVRFADFDLGRLVSRVATRERAAHPAEVLVEGSETRVSGDEDLMERAIENVVRNACQAAGSSGHVWVRFGADATHAFVIVDDDGPGIADADRALKPFESQRPGGLGLGLPLALKILSLHHGTLDLGRRRQGGTQTLCRWPKMTSGATTGNVADGPQSEI